MPNTSTRAQAKSWSKYYPSFKIQAGVQPHPYPNKPSPNCIFMRPYIHAWPWPGSSCILGGTRNSCSLWFAYMSTTINHDKDCNGWPSQKLSKSALLNYWFIITIIKSIPWARKSGPDNLHTTLCDICGLGLGYSSTLSSWVSVFPSLARLVIEASCVNSGSV